jgi:hypothetical protein
MTSNNARIAGSAEDVARHQIVLRRGLRWLHETEQSDGSLLQHHGETVRAQGNRKLTFIPTAWAGHPVIVVAVDDLEYGPPPRRRCLNPIATGELTAFTELLAVLGAEVVHTWNGHPHTSGSLALARPAHPSLAAAVKRYHAGCPEHHAVFCRCGWYARGHQRLTRLRDIPVPADDLTAASQ